MKVLKEGTGTVRRTWWEEEEGKVRLRSGEDTEPDDQMVCAHV